MACFSPLQRASGLLVTLQDGLTTPDLRIVAVSSSAFSLWR
jgi:hypothetical protein